MFKKTFKVITKIYLTLLILSGIFLFINTYKYFSSNNNDTGYLVEDFPITEVRNSKECKGDEFLQYEIEKNVVLIKCYKNIGDYSYEELIIPKSMFLKYIPDSKIH